MKTVIHNLGLGDHIICNGIIRNILQKEKQIGLICKIHNFESVAFMYKDDNVKLISNKHIPNQDLIDLRMKKFEKSFDESFYEKAGINFKNRWNDFYVRRDFRMENILFDNLKLVKPYIFIHEDVDRKMFIDNEYKRGNIFYCRKGITDNIFDFCKIIEEAEEVHCIESSIAFMIDSLHLNSNFYIHRYSRHLSSIEVPTYRNVKEIIC